MTQNDSSVPDLKSIRERVEQTKDYCGYDFDGGSGSDAANDRAALLAYVTRLHAELRVWEIQHDVWSHNTRCLRCGGEWPKNTVEIHGEDANGALCLARP